MGVGERGPILLDTIVLFPGSCAQEGGARDYLVYTHASCIAENFVA